MMRWVYAYALCVLVACNGEVKVGEDDGGPGGSGTGGTGCIGCVTTDGACVPGHKYDACGSHGAPCANCDDDEPLTGDVCVIPVLPPGPAYCDHL